MMSKTDMIRDRFLADRDGKASRMRSTTVDDYRCIVGYGWAVYAVDMGDFVALFGDGYATHDTDVGWAGYSGSTTGHLQDIKRVMGDDQIPFKVIDARPTVEYTRGHSVPRELVRQNEVEPR